jgi:hypothetical protein
MDNSNLGEFEPFFDWLDIHETDILISTPKIMCNDDCWILYESLYFASTGIRA